MTKYPRLSTPKPKLAVSQTSRRLATSTVAQRRVTGRALQAGRLRLWTERGQCCEACGQFVEYPGGFEVDHIVPLALGGPDDDANKQLLCSWVDPDGRRQGCHVDKTRADGSHG